MNVVHISPEQFCKNLAKQTRDGEVPSLEQWQTIRNQLKIVNYEYTQAERRRQRDDQVNDESQDAG